LDFAPKNWNHIGILLSNLGFIPWVTCTFVHFIKHFRFHHYWLIVLFTLIFGKITYGNGWNIGWTLLSYFIPMVIVYGYYLKLKKLHMLD